MTEIEDEPELLAVVLDGYNRAWQHVNSGRGDWCSTVDDLGCDWGELKRSHGPLRLLGEPPLALVVPLMAEIERLTAERDANAAELDEARRLGEGYRVQYVRLMTTRAMVAKQRDAAQAEVNAMRPVLKALLYAEGVMRQEGSARSVLVDLLNAMDNYWADRSDIERDRDEWQARAYESATWAERAESAMEALVADGILNDAAYADRWSLIRAVVDLAVDVKRD